MTAIKGQLITFEGLNGCGKGTQISLLAKYLETNLPPSYTGVHLLREPGGTPVGEQLREILLNTDQKIVPRAELLMMLAARAQLVEDEIKPALEAGKLVLCDRFIDSSIAFQGGGRDIGENYVFDLCMFATDTVTPDLVLFYDIEPVAAKARIEGRTLDRFELESEQFDTIVRRSYKYWQHTARYPILTVYADDTIENVHKQTVSIVSGVIDTHFRRNQLKVN